MNEETAKQVLEELRQQTVLLARESRMSKVATAVLIAFTLIYPIALVYRAHLERHSVSEKADSWRNARTARVGVRS